MLLLLPFLLLTTSVQKLTGLALAMPGPSEEIPPEPPGTVERLRVVRTGSGFRVQADVRNTDVRASVGDVEQRDFEVSDLTALQNILGTFKALDPRREQVTLVPAAESTTQEVVFWMDAVRNGPDGELFPKVVLETSTTLGVATSQEVPEPADEAQEGAP
ncbi:MAG: hypothetical protein QGG40_19375 [Myxococcota bacterium]|jgi:hypothetical protein|nr:hypothetical protein [Myxococcota bacterium]